MILAELLHIFDLKQFPWCATSKHVTLFWPSILVFIHITSWPILADACSGSSAGCFAALLGWILHWHLHWHHYTLCPDHVTCDCDHMHHPWHTSTIHLHHHCGPSLSVCLFFTRDTCWLLPSTLSFQGKGTRALPCLKYKSHSKRVFHPDNSIISKPALHQTVLDSTSQWPNSPRYPQ